MHHARDRRGGARLNVRHRTRDRARGGDAAEEGRDKVCNPLAHQFLVGIVAVVGHGIGHARTKEALDRAEHGEREHGTQKLFGVGPVDVGNGEGGQRLRNPAELRTDRLDGQSEETHNKRREHEHDHGARQVREPALPLRAAHRVALRPEEDDEKARKRNAERPRIEGLNVREQCADHSEKVGRHFRDREPEKVLHLLQADHDGDAVCEADHDRNRDEFNKAPDFEEPHQK